LAVGKNLCGDYQRYQKKFAGQKIRCALLLKNGG
jgi:hypothetical protein